jgi:hypothetical protein
MATRTASPKPKSTRATRKSPARKTPARKAPAKKQAAATETGGAGAAAIATLRRNAFPIAGAIAAGAAAAAAIFFTRRDPDATAAGHPAPDLEGDTHPGPDDRADPHFRPDMDAKMTSADRAALAPALDRPTMVAGSATDTAAPATRH